MRRMRANLSYSLTEHDPSRCLIQVPSIRVLRANLGGQLRRNLLAQEGAHLLGLDREHRLTGQLRVQRRQHLALLNSRSVEYSICMMLQW